MISGEWMLSFWAPGYSMEHRVSAGKHSRADTELHAVISPLRDASKAARCRCHRGLRTLETVLIVYM